MKNNSKKTVRKKYAIGSSITNYLEDPSTELTKNSINIAKAKYETASNPFIQGMKLLGNTAMQVGGKMVANSSEELSSLTGMNEDLLLGLNSAIPVAANLKFDVGGKVGTKVPVEVEGEEMGELPNGQVLDFKGPSHEQGGIDIDLPEGTEIYSKRVKIGGKTMAERKASRERRENRYSKRVEEGDIISKNTLGRVKVANEKQEALDRAVQQAIHQSLTAKGKSLVGREKHAVDPVVGLNELKPKTFFDVNIPDIGYENTSKPRMSTHDEALDILLGASKYPDSEMESLRNSSSEEAYNDLDKLETLESKKKGKSSKGFQFTGGDALNMAGNIFQGVAPYLNTLNQRATDTPNVNAFKNYGTDGLNKAAESEQYIKQITDEALKNLELDSSTARNRNRNTARGVNTMRALDLATEMGVNEQKGKISNDYATQMANQLLREAGLENEQDRVVMQGEQAKDLADRQDKDAFYTAKGEGLRNLGMTTAQAGKQVNQALERDTMYDLLDSAQANFGVTKTGKIYGKALENLNLPENTTTIYPDDVKRAWENGDVIKPEGGVFESLEEMQDYYSKIANPSPDLNIPTVKKTRTTKEDKK